MPGGESRIPSRTPPLAPVLSEHLFRKSSFLSADALICGLGPHWPKTDFLPAWVKFAEKSNIYKKRCFLPTSYGYCADKKEGRRRMYIPLAPKVEKPGVKMKSIVNAEPS